MAERALDIFQVLDALNTKKVDFYASLSDKEKKSIAPVVLTRWLSGTYSKQQVYLINEIVNPYIFSLHHHPQLLWYLMTTVTPGKSQRYTWSKAITGGSKDNACLACIKEYFRYRTKHAEQVYRTIDKINILYMAEELGYTDSELNKIKKELGLTLTKTTAKKKKAAVRTEQPELGDYFDF